MLESMFRQIKLPKGEGWCDSKSGNEEIHCTEMTKNKYVKHVYEYKYCIPTRMCRLERMFYD